MSQSVVPDGVDPNDVEVKSVEWLERNAGLVDVQGARESESTAWERGKGNARDAAIEIREDTGAAVVRLPDGEPHATILVEAAGDDRGPFAGACDCDGWRYHGNACAHLVCRAVRSVIRSGEVPVDVDYFEQLKNAGGPTDAETDGGALSDVDRVEPDDDQDATVADEVDVVDEPDDREMPAPQELEDVDGRDERTMPHTAGDPFASELSENVPQRFVMDLGGEPYVRRAGYAAIARQAGLRVTVDPITAAEDTDFQHARYKAVVRDQDGEVLGEDFGTAHLDGETLDGAEWQLDELAATRAIRRALEWATGAGATLERGGRDE